MRRVKQEEKSVPSAIGRFLSFAEARHVNEINNTTKEKKKSDRENNEENISNCPGLLNTKDQSTKSL